MYKAKRKGFILLIMISLSWLLLLSYGNAADPRVIEILADKDNLFKIPGQKGKQPTITLKVNEVVTLRITSKKGPEWEKDGATHSLVIKELKNQGWNIRLFEGTKDFTLVAPAKPGQFKSECLVKCGKGHDDMVVKLVVTP